MLGSWLETRGEVTTHIILTTQLLTLSSTQLEEAVAAELAANPALEQVAARRCPRCGTLVRQPPCPHCLARLMGRQPPLDDYAFPAGRHDGRPGDDDEGQSLEDYVAQPITLAEHVLAQIGPVLQPADHAIARDILDNLDARGYYADLPAAAAARLGVPEAHVLAALRAVQSAEPAGIAARDAQECLLLQLAHLRAAARLQAPQAPALRAVAALAERLVREAWAPLTHGDLPGAARRLSCSAAQAAQALAFIRANLTPYPALTHWEPAGRAGPGDGYARPDAAVILREDYTLEVELLTLGPEWLRVNPLFRACAEDESPGAVQCRELSERAGLFIKCLGQRQNAFARLMNALVREQRDYFLYGDRALRPMTRAHIAGVVGVHESTISRAVAQKIVSVPAGRLVPLAHLFDGSAAIKDLLAELIGGERDPLTDDELARQLAVAGYRLARRTVAKYRTAMGILPAHMRRGPGAGRRAPAQVGSAGKANARAEAPGILR